MNLQLGIVLGVVLTAGNAWAAPTDQYNMSLQDKVITGPDAFPNLMGLSPEKLTGTKAFVPPDITFKDGMVEEHQIRRRWSV